MQFQKAQPTQSKEKLDKSETVDQTSEQQNQYSSGQTTMEVDSMETDNSVKNVESTRQSDVSDGLYKTHGTSVGDASTNNNTRQQ